MALLKLRRFFQLTLPAELRKQYHLAEGDYLEAEAVEAGILLKPVRVVERKKAWKGVGKGLDRGHATLPPSQKHPEEQEEEIAPIVKDKRPRQGYCHPSLSARPSRLRMCVMNTSATAGEAC
jgi:AbrB family looped-hinge helix DNA binding protein